MLIFQNRKISTVDDVLRLFGFWGEKRDLERVRVLGDSEG